jgi:hypothetical protein
VVVTLSGDARRYCSFVFSDSGQLLNVEVVGIPEKVTAPLEWPTESREGAIALSKSQLPDSGGQPVTNISWHQAAAWPFRADPERLNFGIDFEDGIPDEWIIPRPGVAFGLVQSCLAKILVRVSPENSNSSGSFRH